MCNICQSDFYNSLYGFCAGENESDTIQLLKNHDAFEKTTNPIYTTASQLFTKATHLAKSSQCKPELIQRESSALEGVVNSFALGLDTQRETILQAQEVFKNMEQVHTLLSFWTLFSHPDNKSDTYILNQHNVKKIIYIHI